MSGDELAYLSVREASGLLRSKSLSPVELLEAILARIEAHDGAVMAYLHVASESARAQARAAERALRDGTEPGPLCGIPVAIKDIVDVAGMPTTAGSRVLQGNIAREDAELVARLRVAGAILLGKTNTHEFAYGVITAPTRNPWDLSRIPGGSSGGSAAALAAGMAPGAIGTDTAGSIRLPSALCGVVGLKPTYGRVPTRGVIPLSWSLDHAGPMARTVEDVALLFDALTDGALGQGANGAGIGPDSAPDPARALRGLRAGVPRPYFFDRVEQAVADAVEAALGILQALGVELVETSLPNVELTFAVGRAVQRPEASAYHRERLRRVPHLYGHEIRNDLEVGELLPAVDHVHAQRVRAELHNQWLAVMDADDLDVLVTPTVPVTAPPVEDVSSSGVKGVLLHNTYPFNLAGFPGLSVPCGFDEGGLPIGLQIVARSDQERTVLRTGAAYEAATPWHERHPPEMGAN